MTTERTRAAQGGQSGRAGSPAPAEVAAPRICDWLAIEPDGRIVVYTGKVEVGQDIRTSLAQAVAEELRVPVNAIQLVMADTDRVPWDGGTTGSRTTPVMAAQLRVVAASARVLLLALAAERLQVPVEALQLAGGAACDPATGRKLSYEELANGGALEQPWDAGAPVTPPEHWTIAGRTTPNVDGRAIVTGARRFTPDLNRPGMREGMVVRPPGLGAHLLALDTSAAEALPDVSVVQDGELTGVVARDRFAAQAALRALRAEWSEPQGISSAELHPFLKSHVLPAQHQTGWGGPSSFELGSLTEGHAAAECSIAQTYTVAYIAHAPLEPRAAIAEWQNGRLTVWTGTQRPFGVRSELAQALGIDEASVRVIVPNTGSAYGGKHTGEAAIEASRLARAAGRPVRLVWTREEEFSWAYFRPAGLIEVRGDTRRDGTLTAWEYDCYNAGAAGMRTPYEVPHQRIAFHPTEAPLRQGSYRALAASANHFARETMVDELATAIGMDPLAFRQHNLRDERMLAVLTAAAERAGYKSAALPAGHGLGLACGTEKGSYVAACVEVAPDLPGGEIRVLRVVQAFECGAIVNPDGLKNQVEGAIIQGLGGALFESIDFAEGRVRTTGFSSYRVPRFADVPQIETVLLDRRDLPSVGGSETPIVAIAPAIGNAVYAATGVRLRSLPLLGQ